MAASIKQKRTSASRPVPLPALSPTEKHLDAALLALVRTRKLDLGGIRPGLPFH